MKSFREKRCTLNWAVFLTISFPTLFSWDWISLLTYIQFFTIIKHQFRAFQTSPVSNEKDAWHRMSSTYSWDPTPNPQTTCSFDFIYMFNVRMKTELCRMIKGLPPHSFGDLPDTQVRNYPNTESSKPILARQFRMILWAMELKKVTEMSYKTKINRLPG